MTEYIDKSAAVRILEAKSDMAVCTDAQPYFAAAAKMMGLLPSVDVAPVIHARWIKHNVDKFEYTLHCSNCGWIDALNAEWSKYNYCPNCGAKMDESEDEELTARQTAQAR